MSNIADIIKTAQDKDGMLRRALERIIQLYTDKSHFIYELLQNAEDAGAKSIRFVQYDDRLEVFHDGKPFTPENLQGLCDIGKSDKVDNLNQIGEFGVGFKSVFGICDKVRLYSVPSHYRTKDIDNAIPFAVEINDFTRPGDIPEEEIERSYTTKFVFPYTVGRTFSGFSTKEALNKAISAKLQNLGITTLLFMRNLELIEYEIAIDGLEVEGQYLLEKKTINDHCLLVSALGISDGGSSGIEKDEVISYLKFSRSIDKTSQRTVDIAFPVVVDENGNYECQWPKDPHISVYFPTETESKLGFIVQGPYRTTPNRSSIPAEDADNKRLANETALLLRSCLIELKNAGKLNMSFVKVLPLSARSFDNFKLFYPLYETVKTLFMNEAIIPCKNGGYTSAKYAKITRPEKLATLFTDHLLTQLIGDGNKYYWLPTYLTETNREYEHVYRYLNGELKIGVLRPEDLRIYFTSNPRFLPQRDDDWLVGLYSILENVPAAFSKARNETNMLVTAIVRTSSGDFVAPYRKTDNKQYIPNVFLPTDRIKSGDIHFVDPVLYTRCKHFFDNIIQIQKPNEYEFFIKDVRRRYDEHYVLDEDEHIEDIKNLIRYYKHEEYRDEIRSILHEQFLVLCKDGRMRSPFASRVYFSVNPDGIDIENYFKNIVNYVFYVDAEFYSNHGIDVSALVQLGVHDSLLLNDSIVQGQYDNGARGKKPEWWTAGDFRWLLTIDSLKEALKYISNHPSHKDSIIKSKVIYAILIANEAKLVGTVRIGGNTPNLENESCEMIKILRGERSRDWNGKWLYTEALELVSPKTISKHDLSTSIYGKAKIESVVYGLLGFRKTEKDKLDDLKKNIPAEQLDAFFEAELRQRFGITVSELNEKYGGASDGTKPVDPTDELPPFPVGRVKNIEALKKHAAEMLCFADPVKYEFAVRKIRVSNKPKEARAYLLNMYRYDGLFKYACQLCHEPTASIEAVQIFNKPETELDPMNLCLCPNCAAKYKMMRNDASLMKAFRDQILSRKESEFSTSDHIEIPVGNDEIWFTQIHFAEIKELIELSERVKAKVPEQPTVDTEEGESNALDIYKQYEGKTIKRKDGFVGTIIKVENEMLLVEVKSGPKAGSTTKIQLAFVLNNPQTYQII